MHESQRIKKELENQKNKQKILGKLGLSSNTNCVKNYETAAYDTQKPYIPINNIQQQSNHVKSNELNISCFNQTYLNQSQILQNEQNNHILLKGQLKVPKYQKDQQRIKTLTSVISHMENQPMTIPLDEAQSKDDCYLIDQNDIKGEIKQKILNLDHINFFQKVLRKRKTLFGIKKSIEEIMIAKDGMIGKPLTWVNETQETKALQMFKLLLYIGDSHKTQKIYGPIHDLLEQVKSSSQEMKNQVFMQILKQQNTRIEYSSIKMYQLMGIYLHTISVSEPFLLAYIGCLFERKDDSYTTEKIKGFINFIFCRVLRILTTKKMQIMFIPDVFQISAMLCKRKLPLLIYLSVGNSIVLTVESYESLKDIKKRTLELVGVNTNRLNPDLFGFSSIFSFDYEDLDDLPLQEQKNVWDLFSYWENMKNKFKQTHYKAPQIALYLKLFYPFELHPEDQEGINLYYAQAYFDLFLGKTKLGLQKVLDCSALIMACQPQVAIQYIFPSWSESDKFKSKHLQNIQQASKKYKGVPLHQLRYKFLKHCSDHPFFMTTTFPTQDNSKIYLKPKRIYIQDRKQGKIQQINIRRLEQHRSDANKITLIIQDHNMNKRQISIKSGYSELIAKYIEQSIKFIVQQRKKH